MRHPALVQPRYPTNYLAGFLQPLPQPALVELAVPVGEKRSPWGHSLQAPGPAAIPMSGWARVGVGALPLLLVGRRGHPVISMSSLLFMHSGC